MSYWGAHQDSHWVWDWQRWCYVQWPPASAAPQGRGKGAGGGAPPRKGAPPTGKGVAMGAGGSAPPRSRGRGPGGGKGAEQRAFGCRPRDPPPELALTWQAAFPHGHYLEAWWPVTKAAYPDQGQPHSWRAIEELAYCYACVVKLGGRQPVTK